jgi:small subunit ribosomal protein S17
MTKTTNKEIPKSKRIFVGEVVSDKMDKTVVVKIKRTLKHPLVGKTITRAKKYKAHDEQNEAKLGDWVEIVEGRPLSKTKHMVLKSVVRKAG